MIRGDLEYSTTLLVHQAEILAGGPGEPFFFVGGGVVCVCVCFFFYMFCFLPGRAT